ncbi:hypothetical protein Q757_02975, partial [Oenococcus alcoholitolerans]
MTKLAIVTGAGQGIGQAIAYRLAKDGYTIAVADINEKTAKKTTEKLLSSGYEAKEYQLDVADRKSVFDLVQRSVKELGPLS